MCSSFFSFVCVALTFFHVQQISFLIFSYILAFNHCFASALLPSVWQLLTTEVLLKFLKAANLKLNSPLKLTECYLALSAEVIVASLHISLLNTAKALLKQFKGTLWSSIADKQYSINAISTNKTQFTLLIQIINTFYNSYHYPQGFYVNIVPLSFFILSAFITTGCKIKSFKFNG